MGRAVRLGRGANGRAGMNLFWRGKIRIGGWRCVIEEGNTNVRWEGGGERGEERRRRKGEGRGGGWKMKKGLIWGAKGNKLDNSQQREGNNHKDY